MSRFGLDDVQAQAILDMRLKALQGLDREKLQNEYKRAGGENRLVQQGAVRRGSGAPDPAGRSWPPSPTSTATTASTEIQEVEDELDIEDLIEEEQCVFTLTEAGYIKRTPVSEYAAQSKGGMGKKGITTREEDTVVDVFTASTHDYILFFTDTGKVYRKKGYQIPGERQGRQGHRPGEHPADRGRESGCRP